MGTPSPSLWRRLLSHFGGGVLWEAAPRRYRLSLLACLSVLLLGLSLTAAGCLWLWQDTQRNGQLRFERYVDRLDLDLSARNARVLNVFKGVRGFFDASAQAVNRGAFRIWVASRHVATDVPGIRGVGFIQRVDRMDLDTFLQAERADDAPGFAVKTAGQAPDLFVIKYIEPLANNERAWGYDVGSEAIRREAAERAVATGQSAITHRITLVQDGKGRPGYLYYLPVFKWGSPIDTPAHRRQNLVGLIYAPIVMEEFMVGVAKVADGQLDMQIFDGEQASPDKLVFDLGLSRLTPGAASHTSRFTTTKRLDVGGHSLTLRASSTRDFDHSFDRGNALWFGLAGGLSSILIAIITWLMLVGRVRAEALAQHMTADLSAAKLQAEATLRENTTLLNMLQRFSLMSISDSQGTIIDVNEAFCASSGYERQDMLGRNHNMLSSGWHDAGFWHAMWHLINRGEPWQGDVCNRRRDGSLFWVKTIVVPLRDASGHINRFMSIRTDITESKHNEQVLHDMAERFQLAIDGGSDGLWDWINVNDHKMWWSPQLYRLLGYAPDEFPASLDAFEKLVHPDGQRQALDTIERALTQASPLDAMYLLRTKAGPYRWFRCRGKVFFDANGFAQRMAGSMQDIHERRMAEETVRNHSEQLSAIFSLSPDGFVSFGANGRVNYVSAAFVALAGIEAVSVMGADEPTFMRTLMACVQSPTELLSLDGLLAPAESGDAQPSPPRSRLVLEMKAPTRRMLALSLAQSQGEAVSRLLLVRDVTHETEVDRVKSDFLSMAAHELRTPMSSIYGFIELMLTRDIEPGKQKSLLSKVYRQCEVMITIINELLDLARIESRGNADFDCRDLNLVEVVDEVVADFKRPLEREPVQIDKPMGMVPVHADRQKMGQAFLNVLSNAYKYSPQGGAVRVSFPSRVDEHGLQWVAVQVEDEGMGMSPEQLAHVGERFYRADKSGNIPGTGLGMSIVTEMMKLMGGDIEVHSVLGQGTRVALWMPCTITAFHH